MKIIKIFLILAFSGFIFLCSGFCQEKFPFYAAVVIEGVNVRTDSTINSEIIIKLNKGDAVLVAKEFYDWYRIALPKSSPCYVFGKYITAMSEKTGVINSDNVNVRLKPSTKSIILGKLKKGQSVNIISFTDNWYLIEPTLETYGWIHKSVVKAAEPTNPNLPELSQKKEEITPNTAVIAEKKEEAKNNLSLEGIIYERGKTLGLFRKKITHKLLTTNNVAYLLTGNKYKFNLYVNDKVRIKGYLITGLPNQEYPVIEVQELEKLN